MKVIVDSLNIVFISFSVAKRKALEEEGKEIFTEEDMPFFYHLLLNKLIEYHKTYGEIIYAKEGKHSTAWRKERYPLYKGNREYDSSNDILFKNIDKIYELISLFPSKQVSVEGAEGDDVMYSLSTHFADLGEDVLVISGDRDMVQLHNFNKKINVYDPRKRTIFPPDPNIVEYKAIVGDTSDNIKGVPRLGKKTFEKMMADENVFKAKLNGKEEIYESILDIVDLRRFPKEVGNKIIEAYTKQEWTKFDSQSIEAFLIENSLNQHLNYWYKNSNDIISALGDKGEELNTVSFLDNLEYEKDNELSLESLELALEELNKII